jgi:nitronate monooxygenase
MVALTDYTKMVEIAVDEGIDIIFSGAGLPLNLPGMVPESARTCLAPIVSSGRAATILCKQWNKRYGRIPDAMVVEGPLAGGHLGFPAELLDSPEYTLEKLVPQVVAAVAPFEKICRRPIPVIAAGGIYTGADIHKFMKLGAAGVQMGTRFVVTEECDADIRFKQSYINAKKEDLTIIKSPVGMPGRAIKNSFIESVRRGEKIPFGCPYKCIITCDAKTSPYCIAAALLNARKGELEKGFAFAGANAYRADQILTVKELISDLVDEYEAAT